MNKIIKNIVACIFYNMSTYVMRMKNNFKLFFEFLIQIKDIVMQFTFCIKSF
nr:hypothetical protein B11C_10097 [Bartonella sp. 1-1C]